MKVSLIVRMRKAGGQVVEQENRVESQQSACRATLSDVLIGCPIIKEIGSESGLHNPHTCETEDLRRKTRPEGGMSWGAKRGRGSTWLRISFEMLFLQPVSWWEDDSQMAAQSFWRYLISSRGRSSKDTFFIWGRWSSFKPPLIQNVNHGRGARDGNVEAPMSYPAIVFPPVSTQE